MAEWQGWMQGAGMSRRTIEARVQVIGLLERRTGLDPVTTDWQPIAAFLGDPNFSAGTRQTYQAHIHAWYRWLVVVAEIRLDDPTLKLGRARTPRRKPRPITVAQLGRILSTPMHTRTRWMILLGAYEGLRVHEIAKIRGEHFRGHDLRVIGKGGVDDDVPVHPLVADVVRVAPRRGYWFESHVKLGPITAKSVSKIIGDVMGRAGVPGTAHSLRHFYGTYSLKSSGGNLVVVKQLLRHAHISSAAIYTEVDDAERRAAVAALPVPLALVR